MSGAGAVHTTDREREDDLFADQENLAEAEQARRARQRFEEAWEQGIRKTRQAAKLCVLCGRPLSAIARIGGAIQHAACKSFED